MREEILQTSLQQFLKHGIREMSIQKLIEPLGISTKTVYKYYKNKEQLLEEALLLFHVQQYQMLENLPLDHNAACLLLDIWYYGVELEYKINKAFFQDLNYYYPELAKKMEATISKRFKKQFLLVIEKGIEQGVFRKDIIPGVVLEGIFTLFDAICRTERFKSLHASFHDLLFNTIASYIRGVCSLEGLQALEIHIETLKKSGGRKVLKEKILPIQL